MGVSDYTRQGNLRFKATAGGSFLDPEQAVPKLIALPRLLASADRVTAAGDDDYSEVKTLLDAGSGSLGGARPKASVEGDDGNLLIAKFPHRDDAWDVMAWEKTALDLADAAGIATPRRRLSKVGNRSVLLLERFDRRVVPGAPRPERIGYVSAMTLLEAKDGDERDYLDIVESVEDHGSRVRLDLTELFRRVVFNVAIHNTDDHLRNHGFLRSRGGWALSPVFDVNPNPDLGEQRVTAIVGAGGVDEEAPALLALADECRLDDEHALAVVEEVCSAVAGWRTVSARNGIPDSEQRLFSEALDDRLDVLRDLVG